VLKWKILCDDFVGTLNYTLSCQGTNKVEAILINLPEEDSIYLNLEAFKKMKKLRLLKNLNACFYGEFNFLSNELRLLDWYGYHGESFPSNFCGKNLVILHLYESKLKKLEGVQVELSSLKFLWFQLNCKLLSKLELIYFLFFLDRISKT
jgi:hypothetical protein